VESLHDVLSPAGWWILLAMIQLGGVGIVLLGTSLMAAAGVRLSLRHGMALKELYTFSGSIGVVLRRVLVTTALFELVGALLLRPCFAGSEAPWSLAVFHSVSAFCNAGFSNSTNGLIDYRASLAVNFVVMGLIVTGGLGFRVLAELRRILPLGGPRGRLSVHSRICVIAAAILVAGGALFVGLVEWRGAAFPASGSVDKVVAALFQSVTARTAGFNTVEVGALRTSTLLILCLWMVVGGSPGSTAGGLKTVTLTVVLRSVWAQIRGIPEVVIAGRAIAADQMRRALTVATVYLLTLALVVLGLTLVMVPPPLFDRPFLALLFEACSALGTVGLSMGVTPLLPAAGKILLILAMLVGRVGPLTLVLLVPKHSVAGKLRHPEELVGIG
jgi:trk system potassium uptake protein TrkH